MRPNDQNSDFSQNQSQIEDPVKLASVMERINNTTPYTQLVTKKVDIDSFVQQCDERALITQIDSVFGVECLRKTETGSLYSVHEVLQGGLLYIFYCERSYESTGEYAHIVNWYYVKNRLKYEDFNFAVEGTDIEKITAFDAAADISIKRANRHGGEIMVTNHYLEDGTLMIGYTYKNGHFKVAGHTFREDFVIKPFFSEAKIVEYDGHILPMDLIS